MIVFFVALLPVFIICLYTYKKDKNKEPIRLLIKLFLGGILSCFLVIFISKGLSLFLPIFEIDDESSITDIFIHTFLAIAFIEEGCKFFMSYIIGYKNKEFDEVYDIILYCIVVGCGFAAFENVLYVFGSDNIIQTGILRGLIAIPGHAFDALFMGYHLSLAKMASVKGKKKLERKNLILSILVPTILHGIYDFCILSQISWLMLFFFIFIIALYIISIGKLKYVAAHNKSLYQPNNKFCPHCGKSIEGSFCTACGAKQE